MEPVVAFRAAVCLLGRFPALAGIDLDVRAGEIVLLQGPNGAGKTTVLRACAGLVPVVDGRASVLGVDLRVPGPAGRLASWFWPVCFVVIGLLLVGYRETSIVTQASAPLPHGIQGTVALPA